MNWQMWLLVVLLIFILVILSALALIMYAQSRRIARLGDDLKKSLENHAALEKSLQRSLESHSGQLIETTEHMRMQIANAEAMKSHHEADARAARAELQNAHAEIKKLTSILERKERRSVRQSALQENPHQDWL